MELADGKGEVEVIVGGGGRSWRTREGKVEDVKSKGKGGLFAGSEERLVAARTTSRTSRSASSSARAVSVDAEETGFPEELRSEEVGLPRHHFPRGRLMVGAGRGPVRQDWARRNGRTVWMSSENLVARCIPQRSSSLVIRMSGVGLA